MFQIDNKLFDICVCAIFDGESQHLGFSCAFEIPPRIAKFVVEDGMDLAQACNAAGLSSNPALGEAEGCIGVLSGGRVDRYKYT